MAAGPPFAPDPLWIDHAVEVLRAGEYDHEVNLPVGFSEADGFYFRQGRVLHLSPDAFAKRQSNVSSASAAAGSYAVWLKPAPALDPELLRFTPPSYMHNLVEDVKLDRGALHSTGECPHQPYEYVDRTMVTETHTRDNDNLERHL